MTDVMTIGETMYLLSPVQGGLESASMLTSGIGGSESNVAIGLARLGHHAAWISRVGDDPFGRVIVKRIRGEGVTVHVEVDPHARTGVYFKEILNDEEFRVHYYRQDSAASRMHPTFISEERLLGVAYLFVSGISLAISNSMADTVRKAVHSAKQTGTKVVFDPNIRLKLWSIPQAKESILSLLPAVDYFLPGIDECELLFDTHSEEAAGKAILACGAKHAIVKLGKRGAFYCSESETGYSSHIPEQKQVDPVGAGDGFAAGFLSGLLRSENLSQAVTRGAAVGAMVVTRHGDIEGLPTQVELTAFLENAQKIMR